MEVVIKKPLIDYDRVEQTLVKRGDGKISIRAKNKTNLTVNIVLIVLVGLTAFGFATFNYKDINFGKAIYDSMLSFRSVFLRPILEHATIMEAIHALFVTFCLGILTTITGAIIGFIFALLCASNLAGPLRSSIIKNVVAVIRAVPTIMWVLIFAISAGLGSVAAVVGLTFHSAGYLTKAYSESIEEMDYGKIEALKASGANFLQIVFQSILPTTITSLFAWTCLRFEINFINALAMGAAAGAGGIGYEMFMSGSMYFNLREIGFYTYLVLAIVITIEISVTKLKTKLN